MKAQTKDIIGIIIIYLCFMALAGAFTGAYLYDRCRVEHSHNHCFFGVTDKAPKKQIRHFLDQ